MPKTHPNIHTLAVILARGGSKGIKNKNLYKINGKPLLYWSILASLRSKKINYTWVSSDSEKILNFSKKIGARILKRSKKNSSDSASSEEAWLESINEIETKYQNLVQDYEQLNQKLEEISKHKNNEKNKEIEFSEKI